jgi:hypothetical protein
MMLAEERFMYPSFPTPIARMKLAGCARQWVGWPPDAAANAAKFNLYLSSSPWPASF